MSISAATPNASASQTENQPSFSLDSRLLFLIPTITGVALGALFIPHFALGIAVGTAICILKIASNVVIDTFREDSENEPKSAYFKSLEENFFDTAVFGPIAEEGIFRGIVQPLLTRAILIIVPAAAGIAFGPFTIATTVSVVVSGIFFGAVHYFNDHKDSDIQAVKASVSGIVLGFLSAQFGIGAAIAAHIVNNTIVSTLIAMRPRSEQTIEFVTPA